jgi:hypothetical protein
MKKKEKMSLEKMKTVLTKVLDREEMKQVMAGSGGNCGFCSDEYGFLDECYVAFGSPCVGCGRQCV